MAKQRYSDSDRSEMVRILAESGGNLSEAARRTGWPRQTIEYVARKVGVRQSARQLAQSGTGGEHKARLGTYADVERAATEWEEGRDLHLAQIRDPIKARAASLRDNVIAAGTAQDKSLLLRGRPTSRQETVRITLMAPGSLRKLAGQFEDGEFEVRELPSGASADAPEAGAPREPS